MAIIASGAGSATPSCSLTGSLKAAEAKATLTLKGCLSLTPQHSSILQRLSHLHLPAAGHWESAAPRDDMDVLIEEIRESDAFISARPTICVRRARPRPGSRAHAALAAAARRLPDRIRRNRADYSVPPVYQNWRQKSSVMVISQGCPLPSPNSSAAAHGFCSGISVHSPPSDGGGAMSSARGTWRSRMSWERKKI